MRVTVYKRADGALAVFVEPSRGSGKPPVLLDGITAENVRARVLPVVTAMRRLVPGTPSPA